MVSIKLAFFFFGTQVALADISSNSTRGLSQDPIGSLKNKQRCNSNDDCKNGFYCVGGVANNKGVDPSGKCVPNIVLKQMCYGFNFVSRTIASILIVFAVISIGVKMITGKLPEITTIITLAIASVFMLAPFPIISLVTRDIKPVCDF